MPGVLSDRDKLYQIATEHNISFEFLEDDQITSDTLMKALISHRYKILWMCGHGIRVNVGDSAFILPSKNSFFPVGDHFSSFSLNFCLLSHPEPVLVCVFDFCHSEEMLPLNFNYFGGSFIKKNSGSNEFGFDKIRIAIMGAGLYEKAPETEQGGFLTQYLLYLLKKYKYLSLWLIDGERERSTNTFVIKTNQIIDANFPFIKLV